MITGIIICILWLIGIFISYNKFISKWEKNTKFEKIYFSIIWPITGLLYGFHYAHNNL